MNIQPGMIGMQQQNMGGPGMFPQLSSANPFSQVTFYFQSNINQHTK